MTRRDIVFDAEGTTLRGWFYPAGRASGPGPAVVMAHGFSAVKEMYLDSFAEVFAAAGLSVLVFDNRGFGASDGEPRQEIDPWAQVRDYRHAITYLHTVPEVDTNHKVKQEFAAKEKARLTAKPTTKAVAKAQPKPTKKAKAA